ncbi:hypothetical protein KC19_VG244300 [Ceratodon purpureus]|uniref:Uncharacterized protein n=1 Tax=Ceratodon purpureus TaxID=3225 RepID=A0A8T0HTD4_CERPU|nr:hypothetical protein KC19_VG244300 [Ceratodon purpureus]
MGRVLLPAKRRRRGPRFQSRVHPVPTKATRNSSSLSTPARSVVAMDDVHFERMNICRPCTAIPVSVELILFCLKFRILEFKIQFNIRGYSGNRPYRAKGTLPFCRAVLGLQLLVVVLAVGRL